MYVYVYFLYSYINDIREIQGIYVPTDEVLKNLFNQY